MPLRQTAHTAFTGKHAYRWTITYSQRCFNAGTPSMTLAQHLVSVAVLGLLLTFKQHWIIVGHVSYTVLTAWYCEAGQSTEGQSVLLRKVTCHA